MASPPVSPISARQRNGFLDSVRAVAILRVVVWHTYGFAWISYFVASMPAMFFVAGSLMAHSLRDGGALAVLQRRFRRLLIPFWLLAFIAVYVMLVYAQQNPGNATAHFDVRHIVFWVLPVWDPQGSVWGLTWWAPLWYLRCIAWLFLASPVLIVMWRRLGPGMLFLPLVALTVIEQRLHNGYSVPWQLQDAALYSFFWLLGFAYNDGLFARLSTTVRALICSLAISAAFWWATTQNVPDGVVNASYPLHLFVGLAWLFGSLTLEDVIAKWSARPRVADVLYWVNERALTIYLWQAVGLFAMYQILWQHHHSSLERNLLALPIVASIDFLAVLLFGWLEDVASGRPARIWPTRRPADATDSRLRRNFRMVIPALVISVAGIAALFIATSNIVQAPQKVVQASSNTVPPSGAGLHFRAQKAQVGTKPTERAVSDKTDPVTPEELQSEMEAWLDQWQLQGVTATLLRASGETWTGAAGVHEDEQAFAPNEVYGIASVTKTFTSALILRLVDQKKIRLDDKVSKYVPAYPDSDKFTVRELLQHTSGLISGDDQPNKAIADSIEQGLQFDPGSQYLYSRTGYYLLGLIIERVTGMSYAQALREQILDPLALTNTVMDEDLQPLPYETQPFADDADASNDPRISGAPLGKSVPQYPYHGNLWSAGGLYSNTSDLARWGIELWDGDKVISKAARQQMTTFLGADFDYTGLGTYPFCPCWQENGQLQAERWGFVGLTGSLEYDPVDRLSLAVEISGTILDDRALDALEDFSVRMRQLVRQRPFATS